MRRWLPAPVIGVSTVVAMTISILWWGGVICLPLGLIKLLTPSTAMRLRLTQFIVAFGAAPWVATNRWIYDVFHGRRTHYSLESGMATDRSWMLIANHQSWADILYLFDAFHGHAPFPRFFLKRQLIWLPLVGFICWALDMPFMNRNSKEAIAKNPALKNRDLETTRLFCEKYRQLPITVINFPEGTRCNERKRVARNSPFRHLLRPKSGGLAFAMNAMGSQFAGIIDVTIEYRPSTRSPVWSFLCGEQSGVKLSARILPIADDLIVGNYQEDAAFRIRFQEWVNEIWEEKDRHLDRPAVPELGKIAQQLISEPPSS